LLFSASAMSASRAAALLPETEETDMEVFLGEGGMTY
jgi:hypothetical protein